MTRVVYEQHDDSTGLKQTDTDIAGKVQFPIYQHSPGLPQFNVAAHQQRLLSWIYSRFAHSAWGQTANPKTSAAQGSAHIPYAASVLEQCRM